MDEWLTIESSVRDKQKGIPCFFVQLCFISKKMMDVQNHEEMGDVFCSGDKKL